MKRKKISKAQSKVIRKALDKFLYKRHHCGFCGRFINLDNSVYCYTPDSAFGPEEFFNLCLKCSMKNNLISLEEYNKSFLASEDDKKTGILCPSCKNAELLYVNRFIFKMTSPPQTEVYCEGCGYKRNIFIKK